MDSYPNVWPVDGLFGFSGVDGETRFDEALIMTGRDDGVGWNFWLEPKPCLLANVGSHRLLARNKPTDFVLPDCWFCSVQHGDHMGVVEGAFVDRASVAVTIGFSGLDEGDSPDLFPVGRAEIQEEQAVFRGKNWWLAVVKSEPGPVRRFGIGYSRDSEGEALERAAAARDVELREVIGKRLGFYEMFHVPDSIVDIKRRVYLKAAGVLKMNVESPQGRYGHRWFRSNGIHHRRVRPWDTAFQVLGMQHIHRELAHESIHAVLAGQQEDGRLPLAAGPSEPEGVSEEFSHPPLLSWVVCQKFERYRDVNFVKSCYPNLVRYVEWFDRQRKNENGLYGWRIRSEDDPVTGSRGAESAMSNSPRFDSVESMTAIDLSSYMANEYRALEVMALELGKGSEAAKWHARDRAIRESVNALMWDSEDMFYYDLDANGAFIPVKTTAGFMPMFAKIADRDQAEALRTHLMHPHEFWTPCPVASVAEDEAPYSKDMWRGAMWPTMNVLVYRGLISYKYYEEARALAHKTVNEIAYRYAISGCLYEYYDPAGQELPNGLPRKGAPGEHSGSGFGVIEEHQATAAAYLYLIHEIAGP